MAINYIRCGFNELKEISLDSSLASLSYDVFDIEKEGQIAVFQQPSSSQQLGCLSHLHDNTASSAPKTGAVK